MCLIVFAWDTHPKYKLIVAANRDEFYHRPTKQAEFWDDYPNVFGGRDLEALGTWIAVSKSGKFGALTNFRDPNNIRTDVHSRGEIIPNFLNSNQTPEAYLSTLHSKSNQYNGFNVLVGDFMNLLHYSNQERKMNPVSPGIHGLSNALLDTDWPKVTQLKNLFSETIATDFSHEDLLKLLSDDSCFENQILPQTGVSAKWERALSPICIRTESYGTTISTVLTLDRFGKVSFTEKTLPVGGRLESKNHFEFNTAYK